MLQAGVARLAVSVTRGCLTYGMELPSARGELYEGGTRGLPAGATFAANCPTTLPGGENLHSSAGNEAQAAVAVAVDTMTVVVSWLVCVLC